MTIPDTERRTSYSPSADTTEFAVGFTIFDLADVAVFHDGEEIVDGWSVTGTLSAGRYDDAVVVAEDPGWSGVAVDIVGRRRPRNDTGFSDGRGVSAANLNLAFDKITAIMRELFDNGGSGDGGGSGEVTLAASIGTDGIAVYKEKVSNSLKFRAVRGVQGITAVLNSDTETVDITPQNSFISGIIAAPTNGTYIIAGHVPVGFKVKSVSTICDSGTCTATWKNGSTALGGTANSVSSSRQTQAHASANVFAAADDLKLTISSASSCLRMSYTIEIEPQA